MAPRFTVLLPVHRPPALLPFAIESVRGQTLRDWELFVICDGAPSSTETCAQDYASRDPRIRVFKFPKGERHGEHYRHLALQEAAGEYVAQIADDDLWFPHHLVELENLLRDADFGHSIQFFVDRQHGLVGNFFDIGRETYRRGMLTKNLNGFGPTNSGYRLSAYRSLAEGWAPSPPGFATDLHMWRKFLSRPDFAFATRYAFTALQLRTPERKEMSLDERAQEMQGWFEKVRNPIECDKIVQAGWRWLFDMLIVMHRRHATDVETHEKDQSELMQLRQDQAALQSKLGAV